MMGDGQFFFPRSVFFFNVRTDIVEPEIETVARLADLLHLAVTACDEVQNPVHFVILSNSPE